MAPPLLVYLYLCGHPPNFLVPLLARHSYQSSNLFTIVIGGVVIEVVGFAHYTESHPILDVKNHPYIHRDFTP